MREKVRRVLCGMLAAAMAFCLAPGALADGAVTLMPGVTPAMSDADWWADRQAGADQVILTPEEIEAFNLDSAEQEGTMVMDLRTGSDTYDGKAYNENLERSATADAEHYFGWTYTGEGEEADWDYYQAMIDNCLDPDESEEKPVRYGIAVRRTLLRVFPSPDPIQDDPNDPDFDYQALSSIRVNEPMLIYNTSADGKYYQARISSCSGWVPAEDVALCADKDEWLSAWDLPAEKLLVVYGNKEYTDASNSNPDTAVRMLSQGTALELVTDIEPDELIGNRSPYHNYVVYLPVRRADGGYEKQMALVPETAKVSIGYLPLTMRNIAMVALESLGDAYGWGGMLDTEDCSGMIRTIYKCFGLDIGRNGNWQYNMNIEKIDMTNMPLEEKRLILDQMPLGSALCFDGHEMMYLGKVDGEYYVVSTVSSIVSPNSGEILRTRDVMINDMQVKRGSGKTWLGALNMAFMPCYATAAGKTYDFPAVEWYHEGVAWCLGEGVMRSLDIDDTFGIGQTATRADLAYGLWVLSGAAEEAAEAAAEAESEEAEATPEPAEEPAYPFTDVAEDDEARDAIAWATEQGLMSGVSDTAFAPDGAVSQNDVQTALWALAKSGELLGAEDGQVPYYWAPEAGVITQEDWANPIGEPMSREGMAMWLARYGQLCQAEQEAEEEIDADAA